MKLTIAEAQNFATKKDGSPMTDSRGKAQFRCVIKTVEKGEQRIGGFSYTELKAGEVIEADLKTEMYQGQPQLKFSIVTNPQRAVEASRNNSDILTELKNHTAHLKLILGVMEGIKMGISTHQTIAAMSPKSITPNFEPVDPEIGELPSDSLEVEDEFDFGKIEEINPFE